MKKRIALSLLASLFVGILFAQEWQMSGIVTNQDGQPVEGAHVRLYTYNTGLSDIEYLAETGADGCYSVKVEQADKSYSMSVTATGFAIYQVEWPFSPASTIPGMEAPSGDIVLCDRLDFTADKLATIILPETPSPSWGRYYRLSHREGRDIIFVREQEPKANVPYVIFPNYDFSIGFAEYLQTELPEAGYVPIPAPDAGDMRQWGFHGSYLSTDVMPIAVGSLHFLDDTPDCVTDKNQRYRRIGAFRAYLQIPASAEIMTDSPNFVFVGETTGITAATPLHANGQIFDLQGRRQNGTPQRGIYIRDGKKILK